MFVNKFKINLTTLPSGATETYLNFSIDMDFQNVDQSELIERVFVDNEVSLAINPILDYDKVRFTPLDIQLNQINKITYNLNLFDSTNNYVNNYGDIGFNNDDVRYRKNNFKESFLNLSFYNNDNALTQKLVSNITLFVKLNPDDYLQVSSIDGLAGQPKPVNQIPINFMVESPIISPRGFAEGYYLYDYKDELKLNESKYLYMRASFKNAKTGKSVNLMVKNVPLPINELVHELYTRYKMTRTTSGFYYEIDDTYHGNSGSTGSNNVIYNTNDLFVNLYEIKST
jgi:hypothetical protein